MRFLNAFAGLSLLLASAATSTVSAQCPPDTEAPVITNMPANILQTAEPGICGATISWTIPTATDNCEVTSFSADQVPDDFYSVGITTVTYTAMDAEGNMSAASFTITITDDEDPSISDMPADISVNNDTGNCSSIVTWDAPSADDNCGISTLTSDHDSGDAFPVGTTTVTYTATDVNGNSITDSFDITVTDNEAPTAAASDLTLVLDASGAASTTAAAVNNGSSDNCNIASIDLSQTDFDCTHLGNNTVTLTVTDIHSNQSTATATITVQDNQAPAIAQMADISATNDANNCSAVVTWTDPAVTDNCTYTLTTDIASGATFNVGVTTVTYSVTDAGGNTDAMSFDVTVTDTQAPSISGMPAADIIQGTDAGVCTAAVTWSAPTATDNCTTDAVGNPANVMLTSTHQPGSDFAIGTTTVTYTAIDIYGNTSTATFDVIVTSTDTDGDGICDTGDNCSDTEACNYADPANVACATPVDCDTCSDATGTGTVVDNDADNDGVCDDDEIAGCQDNTACNYNSAATDSDGSCTYTVDPCDTCSGETDGTGSVLDNDADDDGVCNDDEIAGCQDNTACNYNASATDSDGSCTYTDGICETCVSGAIVDNDADDDGVCDANEIAGCQDNTACNYNAAATDSDGSCIFTADPCDTCSGATDGSGTVIDNDSDNDGVCDADEIVGCQDNTACNYNAAATDAGACTYVDGICETCESGIIVDNDADDDGVCDNDEIAGCQDNTACNYNAAATDSDGSCTYTDGICETCVGGAIVDNDADDDGVCNADEIAGCQDNTACNYNAAATDSDGSCTYTDGICETCVGGAIIDNDADDDGVCDDDEITGCQDASACNYNAEATDPPSNAEWTLLLRSDLSTVGLGEFSSGNQVGLEDGTGDYRVGLTGAQMASMDLTQIRVTTASGYEVIFEGPFDANAFDNVCGNCNCQGNALATDLYWSGGNGGCYGSTHFGFSRDGNIHVECGIAGGTQDQHWGHFHRGGVNTGVYTFGDDCINEVEWSETFFIYGAFGYYDQTCAYTDGVCETCSGETDGSGSVVDNDADDDGICDADEIVGCQDAAACNYNSDATDAGACTFAAGCDTCSGETDGTGSVVDNDADNDGTCDSVDGCPNDPAKTDPGVCGCGNIDTDVDNDGVCDDVDLCTDPLANNYQSPGGEECESCPNAPIFDSIYYSTAATTLSSADGAITLEISGNAASTLFLTGINGATDYTIALPDDLNDLEAGYYIAQVQDADGCWGVADTSVGGTTLQQPAIQLEVIIPFTLCCSGCGINDIDADGICDDDDNCTDQSAPNFDDPANTECLEP